LTNLPTSRHTAYNVTRLDSTVFVRTGSAGALPCLDTILLVVILPL